MESRKFLRQHEVTRRLNALKSVVSIMIRALERLGFVRRTRCTTDRRTFLVAFTAKARWVLRKIYFEAMTAGMLPLALMSIFSTPKTRAPLSTWREALDQIVKWARPIRAWGIGIPNDLWVHTGNADDFYNGVGVDNPNLQGDDGWLVAA